MTAGFIDGTLLRMRLSSDGGTTENIIAHAQEASLNLSKDLTDVITKDTGGGGWREIFPKTKSGTLTFNGLITYDYGTAIGGNVVGTPELFGYFNDDTLLDWDYTTEVSGDEVDSGQGYLTALNKTATADTESSYDATIEVHGAVTNSTVA